ncbi:MAG: HAD family hydrolase [Actinobacteria bacterium]|nr:HAD family hydrolase [Actinomycetota bacterium]
MSKPLVLFDLDGTLVDHDAAELSAITGWIGAAGFPADVDGVPSEQVWRQVSEAAFPDYFAGRLTFEEQRRVRVRTFLPMMGVRVEEMADAELDRHFLEYRSRYEASWQPFPDAVDCLLRLRSTHRLAVLTNGDQSQQDDKMRRTGLAALVETTIASSSLGMSKPMAGAFHAALTRLGADPTTTTYVGDRLDTDARAACAAGLAGVWLNRAADSGEARDVRVIATLDDLP